MALKLNGKDDRLTRQDFLALARTIGLTVGDAEVAMSELAGRLSGRAKTLCLPAFAGEAEAARFAHDKVTAITVERCAALSGVNASGANKAGRHRWGGGIFRALPWRARRRRGMMRPTASETGRAAGQKR